MNPETLTDGLDAPGVAARRYFIRWSAAHEPLDELGTPLHAERRAQMLLEFATPDLPYDDVSGLYAALTSLAADWVQLRDRTEAARDLVAEISGDFDTFAEACDAMKRVTDHDIDEVLGQLVPTIAAWVDVDVHVPLEDAIARVDREAGAA